MKIKGQYQWTDILNANLLYTHQRRRLGVVYSLVVFYKLKSAQFIIEKVPTLKKERLKLLFKRGPLYY